MDAEEAKRYTYVLIVAITLGIILLYFIISLIKHQRRNLRLNQEKVEAEVMALEKERRRIAADLHDEVGPTLSGIKLILSGLEVHDSSQEQLLRKVNNHIDTTITRMRQISNNLMPRVIEKRKLYQALEAYIQETERFYPLKIEHNLNNDTDLSVEKKLHVYRIFQEIMHNTIKHAEATKLEVQLLREGNNIVLQTKDNGKGFAVKGESKKGSGLGLRNLTSRAEILGGDIHIDSQPGKGTHITLKIPVL